jgi:hypothetical protein
MSSKSGLKDPKVRTAAGLSMERKSTIIPEAFSPFSERAQQFVGEVAAIVFSLAVKDTYRRSYFTMIFRHSLVKKIAAQAGRREMSSTAKVWVDKNSRVICQGFTGKQVGTVSETSDLFTHLRRTVIAQPRLVNLICA